MELDSVRELKQRAFDTILQPMLAASAHALRLAVAAADMASAQAVRPKRLMALGVAKHDKGGYKLAVRLQRRNLLARSELRQLERLAKGEWDVRYVGQVRKRALPWYQLENRPLLIGSSVAHERVTAGTLGGFVRLANQENGDLYILSNNHVLATKAAPGSATTSCNPVPTTGRPRNSGWQACPHSSNIRKNRPTWWIARSQKSTLGSKPMSKNYAAWAGSRGFPRSRSMIPSRC